ncbi:hypothetical protein H257_18000 [Aphanomyces astaci]|uniref:N-acetylgalactosaminide beta-1,3-galactosyltransferase n=1 Tax=Aphanomyces astaci TaxID=112090 RepID=W4FCM7_APHAT|nr:hypothetical protein H257_18000 [Aphanomyces astaci]ETV65225.1 hypothetical protein H257_18000 [Aphanomyces astaci]|eukprot:XP_009845292.1 hypothetical protein H257_18000 [Aphanomyces astaci]
MYTVLSLCWHVMAAPWLVLLCCVLPLLVHCQSIEDQLGDNMDALRLVRVLPEPSSPQKILCWVNTFDENHNRARSIKATWGQRCDKLVFMSNVEDLSIPTARVVAPATHLHLWQKHRAVVRLLWREYGDAYDWIFKCDDDTFVLVENLRAYVATQSTNMSRPLLLGHRMTLQWWEMQRAFEWFYGPNLQATMHPKHFAAFSATKTATMPHGGLYYTPGGGGYAFNMAYLKLLVEHLDEPFCLPDEIVPDDWAISFCMRFLGVVPVDTRDSAHRERFHQYSPARIYHEDHNPDAFDHDLYPSIEYENNWFSDHGGGIGWQNASQCAAPDTISFHYIKPPLMELVEAYYYPPNKSTSRLRRGG